MSAGLCAEGLGYGHPGRTLGRDVMLAVRPGEVTALLGPNGGGKTTLLKTLLGLLPPHAGRVLLDGQDIHTLPARMRGRLIGYVPQGHAAAFAFTVGEVALMGRTAHAGLFAAPSAQDRRIAAAMLERLGIGHLADQPATMVSGGERQLCLIARALAQEPRYIVLDEPTASLDFSNQGVAMRQIAQLAGDGLGVLFTTHDPNQAARFADRVAMLRQGELIWNGDGASLGSRELAALYGAPVEELREDGRRAFLPG